MCYTICVKQYFGGRLCSSAGFLCMFHIQNKLDWNKNCLKTQMTVYVIITQMRNINHRNKDSYNINPIFFYLASNVI
jgi:hypothetical protein